MTASGKKSHWGFGIWLLYVGFVVFILSLAGWASLERVDLVSDDYYEQGLAYQKRIDQIRETQASHETPGIVYDQAGNVARLCFPEAMPIPITGSVLFFCPSNEFRDFRVALAPDSSRCQTISDKRLSRGYWRAKCEWEDAGGSHYWEDTLYVR
jgi:hypothetical protein